MSVLNKTQTSISDFSIEPIRLVGLVSLIEAGDISNKQAKELFELMQQSKEGARDIASKKAMLQISDPTLIQQEIDAILQANPQSILDFKEGKDRAVGFLIGQIMKKTGGKVNPGLTNQLLLKTLKSK